MTSGGTVRIDKADDDGVILFMMPQMTIPTVANGDNDTDMFLNIPINSRDIFAPFFFKDGENEYLRICGDIFIDIKTVPEIKSGKIISSKKEENAVFRISAGKILEFDKPEDVSVIILNNNLSVIYTSHDNKPMPELIDGYIIFANDSPMDFEVKVLDTTKPL